ncbi:hypothetical protein CHLRE_04g230242v5 [Chlamydomonas reinhardtii]|uniref:Uncharacterized protein n=1 Tax=Chlamydomonas reinhardtii TaxID=3055 RepID=A0A2K3DUW3_CHLRE|nr:uncharacterized protein CHLRE_04g230242v5 [Chlamydomonas reinhardtii]PNW84337.1 hypothetical protein CHLRE_04g230242v5 [Chlamydomonas reinhardtii]
MDGSPQGTSEASTSSKPLEAAWKEFGRDNPAGKALFKLYNKDAAKQIGNAYNSKNKAVHEKKLATGWSPLPVAEPPKPKLEKPVVAVPRFPKRMDYESSRAQYIPRRRHVDVIRAEIDAEYERMRTAPQPPPSRAVLDDKEKTRLADLMRFRGKVPAVTPEQVAAQARAAPKKSEQQQLEEMFEQIVGEIEERRAFLRDLEAAGRLKLETVHMVRSEIQQRVADLQRVDALLQQYTAGAGAGSGASPSH